MDGTCEVDGLLLLTASVCREGRGTAAPCIQAATANKLLVFRLKLCIQSIPLFILFYKTLCFVGVPHSPWKWLVASSNGNFEREDVS